MSRAVRPLCYRGHVRRKEQAGSSRLAGGTGITGPEEPGRGVDASGLSAGITIVAAILLGTGLGLGLGLLVSLPVPLAMAGAAVGIVFGFYVVYVKWIKLPKP
jgi:hypothetical protein